MAINVEIEKSLKMLQGHSDFAVYPPPFLLAVSGGPDSQCLLKAFPHVAAKFGYRCVAAGIDHGLRPEADSELDLAEELAIQMKVPFVRAKVKLTGYSNVQCEARVLRYGKLYKLADKYGCGLVVTAHHFDDRAETVIIRLLRGQGVGSLAVMPPIAGRVYRPMLTIKRSEIIKHINRWHVKFAHDPSNDNMKYLRAKIRKEILPLLESINPQIKQRLNDLSDELLDHGSIMW
jgi:tRNA(Ile)-lysidine synthase